MSLLSTKAGDLELQIPKLRHGAFFPSLLEPRRRIDRALWAVVMEAYVHGVSTRKVDDLVRALGIDAGISKSEVSRICASLDEQVGAFRDRSLGHRAFPYLFLKGHLPEGTRGATGGVKGRGDRHRRACRRWPRGARPGGRRLRGRRLLDRLPAQPAGPRALRGQARHLRRPRGPEVGHRRGDCWRRVAKMPRPFHAQRARPGAQGLGGQFPAVEHMLTDAAPDICAFASFPQSHWRRVWSTNPLERVNGEIKRRADVAGIFPNEAAIVRLVGAVLMETHDEWQITERQYFSEGSMAAIYAAGGPPATTDERPALLAS